ncbi:peptidase M61 domain protein [Emticicia oligotrophica DSM 17448]|uniref:Peptidase M61 domain protein n=1 Tax=Emticicia oligotrophica (strain DSM 17448 / CIP 109782 / MTCC 6937 / GPTSA100-15) TaxID=929562 RepID=A0ABN4APV0_EMTOG|nr:peptidase M61 [Emticicia oligotrophica]AFK04218.1 peptidase M61 domain protein [Emticicia oligotrophica DSM 17448]
MQKTLMVLSFGLLMASCTKKAVVSSSQASNGSTYQYSVDLTKVVDDKLEVTLINPKIESEEIIFRLPKTVPGTYSTDDYGRYLSDFKAFDSKGNLLTTNKLDVNSYTIKDAKKLHNISYKIDDTWDSPEIKGTKIFEPTGSDIVANKEYSINTHCFFGYFDGMKQVPYQVTFTKPSGFYGSTSMVAKSSTATTDIFEMNNYMDLVDAPILYTQPDTTVLKIGGADILVSVYSPNKKASSKEIAANINTLLEAQKEYLGGKLPIKKYAFLIVLSDNPNLTSFGALEHSYSSFYYLPEGTSESLSQTVKDVASHEFFHIVTPLNIHSEEIGNFDYNAPKMSKHLWMYEGLTEYAAGHMQAKYNLITLPKYLDMLRQKVSTMKSMKDNLPFTEMSANVLDKYKNQYMNVYNKGALIGLCLDIKLRQLSDGKYGTQSLMQDLSKTYGKTVSFKDDELFDKITSLTYPEIRQFFATYVEGKEPLPLAEILQSVGIDYISEATVKQASLGGVAIGFNQQTGRLKITSIDKVNEFGKQMGYKANDELISINGQAMEMMKIQTIMTDFNANTKEGEMVTVEVARKNAEGKEEIIKLSAPAILVEVKQRNVLKLAESPSAEQLKLRNQWLKP